MDANENNAIGRPGIAAGWFVTSSVGTGSWKEAEVEKLGNRHYVTSFDFNQCQALKTKIERRIEHTGQCILAIGYKEDWRRGATTDVPGLVLLVSEWQEVWAADGRGLPARWIAAKDLMPGHHVLKLGFEHAKGSWAEIEEVAPPKHEKYRNFPAHELVLIDGDSFCVGGVLCRASSVPAKVSTKRVVNPLKDYPIFNYVPQPKSLAPIHAEVWYRKSASLLPRCLDLSLAPLARLKALLVLKTRLRDVAANACHPPEAGWDYKREFTLFHRLPILEELLPELETLAPEALNLALDSAIAQLSAPGPRKYSETTGGAESHHVLDDNGRWVFGEQGWVMCF